MPLVLHDHRPSLSELSVITERLGELRIVLLSIHTRLQAGSSSKTVLHLLLTRQSVANWKEAFEPEQLTGMLLKLSTIYVEVFQGTSNFFETMRGREHPISVVGANM
jgi:hypothetical protein